MTAKLACTDSRARVVTILAAGIIAASLLTTGCGLGTNAVSSASTTMASPMSGKMTGGPNPIVGASVKLFITGFDTGQSAGYGVAEQVREANQVGANAGQDTDANGNFTFAGGYPCPAGQFLYIQSNGGDTGSGYNGKAMLVAALGRCEDLFSGGVYTGGFIFLNELSTVASAYALGGFASFNGIGPFTTVRIGAPPANNASIGCVANGTTCPTTAAAGLRHAFQNAINLVPPFQLGPNSRLTQNPSAVVPQQLINTIANSLVACVNSNGSNAACQTIFAATGTNYTDGTIFEVAVNLAKNPRLFGSGYTTTQFFNAATPQTSFYQPSLNAAPEDYTIAILMPALTGKTTGVQGLTYPVSGTLDINDNYFVGNYNSSAQTVSNAVSFKSDGTLVSFTPDSTSLLTATANGASVDKVGNLYLLGSVPNTQDGVLSRFTINSATGAIASTPTSIFFGNAPLISSATDSANNLWFGSFDGFLTKLPAGTVVPTLTRLGNGPATAVAVDPNQNIWFTTFTNDANNGINVLQNQGTVAAPSYPTVGGILHAATPNGIDASGVSFASANPYIAYVSNLAATQGITSYTPTLSGATVTSLATGVDVSSGTLSPSNNQTDGAGVIWAADGTDINQFTPGTFFAQQFAPCKIIAAGNTVCAGGPYSGIQSLSIDSAGSIWFVSAATGTVSEMIGAATPTWPLLSLGLFGKPQ